MHVTVLETMDGRRKIGGRLLARASAGSSALLVLPLLALALSLLLASCSDAPGIPPASSGSAIDEPVPVAVENAPLVDQQGNAFTLAALRGKVVMLVPFMTLCSEVCPMTTGNLLAVENTLRKDGVESRVEIVELSVDPDRDTPGRLAAYAGITGSTWDLVTESPQTLSRVATFFGFYYVKVPQGRPPAVDWLTGKPLAYDVEHSDGFVLLGPSGRERFVTGATPSFHGSLASRMHAFLDAGGLQNLAHPAANGWTPSSALRAIGWLLGRGLS
jgi:protein SCO1/2